MTVPVLSQVALLFSGGTVLLAFATIYVTFYIYKKYRYSSVGWAAVVLAAAFMFLNRAVIFSYDTGIWSDYSQVKVAGTLLFALSTLAFFIAAWKIREMSGRYDLIEKKMLSDIITFEERKKKRSK